MINRTIPLVVFAAAGLCAQSMTQEERDFAAANLQASRKAFLAAVAGVSEAQWKFKPAPDRWSIAETAEHIAMSEDMLYQLVTEKILKAEPVKPEAAATRAGDEAVVNLVRDRSQKANAPEFLKPSNRWATRDALLADFNKSRDRTAAFVKSTGDDLRSHSTPHPKLGRLDAYQWVLLISAHSERHTAQINEVKSDPNYPKE